MTGAETLDVARDAIWTIVVVSSPLMVIGLVVGFVTLLLALPFMADSLHSHMMRISSRIIGG
jgi:flagellar biosynthetic protein FliQ